MQQQELGLRFVRQTRDERIEQVIRQLRSAGSLTFGGIAHVCGLKRSPYLRGIVNEVVSLGFATKKAYKTSAPLPTFVYTAAYPELTTEDSKGDK